MQIRLKIEKRINVIEEIQPQLFLNVLTDHWRRQTLVLGGANPHFYLKISLYIALMFEKFKNSIISSA